MEHEYIYTYIFIHICIYIMLKQRITIVSYNCVVLIIGITANVIWKSLPPQNATHPSFLQRLVHEVLRENNNYIESRC